MSKLGKALFVGLILVFSLLLISNVSADWAMFRSNPSRDGVGTGKAVLNSDLIWKSNISFAQSYSNWWDWSSPVIAGGVAYVGSSFAASDEYNGSYPQSGELFAFNASNGALIWDYIDHFSHRIITPAVDNGVVVFGSMGDQYFGALNASNGVSIWNYTTDEGFSSPAIVNGVVYFGSYFGGGTGIVNALNVTNGDQLWNFTNYNNIDVGVIGSSPAVVNGVVYIGSEDGNLYALNAINGRLLWNYTAKSSIPGAPAVADGVVYFANSGSDVYALNATAGTILWTYHIGPDVIREGSSPAVANGVVYIGSARSMDPRTTRYTTPGNVYALNASTGDKIWVFSITGGDFASDPAFVNGVVYIGSSNGFVYALNEKDGNMLWSYQTGSNNYVDSSPAVADGVLYIGGGDGNVYALSNLPNSAFALPAVVVGTVSVVVVCAGLIVYFKKRKHV